MSDLGDTFKAWDEEKRKKREANLAASIEILGVHGVTYERLSEHHLRIGDFDFWPSTGKYINRKTNRNGRGVMNLLVELKRDPE